MNPSVVKYLITLTLCMVAAVFLGFTVGSGEFQYLFLLSYLLLLGFMIAVPGNIPLLALGLISPFILPLPFVRAVPFLLLILGLIAVKYFFQNLVHRNEKHPLTGALTVGFGLFFGWVALRYAMKPSLPNLSGIGPTVTGFRAYLNYALCFLLLLALPRLLHTPADLQRLLQWMGKIALFFILLLLPFAATKSLTAAAWLDRFGLTVALFDNGFLRFVALPPLGVLLVTLACLKHVWPLKKWQRAAFWGLGLAAVFAGGSRAGIILLFTCVLAILLIQRRYVWLLLTGLAAGLLWTAFYFVGETIPVRGEIGYLRVLSVASPRISRLTNAEGTYLWRKVRWQRAMEEIKNNPVFGKGYGGLENAWIFSESLYQDAVVDIDLAAGSIHNGFLACAYSLGLPALMLFGLAYAQQLYANHVRSRKFAENDPLISDLHTFIGANLAGLAPSIYVGNDLNNSMLWLLLGLGVLLARMKDKSPMVAPQTAAEPPPIRNSGSLPFGQVQAG